MKILAVLLMFAGSVFAQLIDRDKFINEVAYPATVSLYQQHSNGDFIHLCAATAFSKTKDGYIFVTASHCVEDKYNYNFYFVGSDVPGTQFLIPVINYEKGSEPSGYDVAFLHVITDRSFPLVKIGESNTIKRGEKIFNISTPSGLGKMFFEGIVSLPLLTRPEAEQDSDWTGYMILQISGPTFGSSGSAVICENQQAICGIFVGRLEDQPVAVPVERLKWLANIINNNPKNRLGLVFKY